MGDEQLASWRETWTNKLHLPTDALYDVARITWISKKQLHIENYRGIHRFQSKRLLLSTGDGYLEITGDQLEIESMSKEELFVHGQIDSCRYIKEPKEQRK